ncbi:hypothetical protein [Rhizobium lentis]|uniref:hypothetical protein n=1 Tax=Rhizobium lentis TaxID=1138194 RepID=UPI001A9280BC|nr:hypothetical protein [Rhizobium lentis]MBX4997056.1 hypothetical protein [Rhizobium lentis]MBX5018567.1 hypothetical protein [Rhizobium lentis]MBX5065048.1 hypothetical protein [Rhizobium lentis]MBX5077128.1 hypothetical protein [Rhizobium lentis]QSW96828.1 hypothetical protein J0663_27975 [Rhizobium lentis]
MIWENYVFRRGVAVEDLWDDMYADRKKNNRPMRLLYIAGRGFDVRAKDVISKYVERLNASGCQIQQATLLLIGFSGYQLSPELEDLTSENASILEDIFGQIGKVETYFIDETEDDEELNATIMLRLGAAKILNFLDDVTDIVLDVSSLPRIVYLTILLSVLARIVPAATDQNQLTSHGVTFQVLVGEDPELDSKIAAQDPSNDLVLIPGYSEAFQSEALRDMPMVWFPILGENRLAQVQKVESNIPDWAEICPVLPHPSKDPRRGDKLLTEYDNTLFAKRQTPLSNIIYAHEGHPFEVYRQLLEAMLRFRNTLSVIGGSRLVVTPLASKLITVGSALACFEMKMRSVDSTSGVAIPYAEPKRYVVEVGALRSSKADLSVLVLTGDPFQG